ncbi:DUF86 domain-containing protein [Niveispirillum sp. KHB5.9]|uniref:HepT-like ribonuclease domain-containing protein n=1 Tax=Niveispirillum sp. KHB5.9 TaxID=3400269 RepID=UPI003A8BB9A7
MRRDPNAYLWDIRDSADAITEFTTGRSFKDYQANRMLRSAVERQFEIIGEALGQLAKIAPDVAREIPDYARIVAFRNLLIHGYAVIDDAIVWRTVQEDLPALRIDADRLLSDANQG